MWSVFSKLIFKTHLASENLQWVPVAYNLSLNSLAGHSGPSTILTSFSQFTLYPSFHFSASILMLIPNRNAYWNAIYLWRLSLNATFLPHQMCPLITSPLNKDLSFTFCTIISAGDGRWRIRTYTLNQSQVSSLGPLSKFCGFFLAFLSLISRPTPHLLNVVVVVWWVIQKV